MIQPVETKQQQQPPECISTSNYTTKEVTKNADTQMRTFDEYGYRRRVFGIVIDENTQEVLLTSTSKRKDAYIIPGGGIDPGEEPEQSVVREVLEECGVNCTITRFCKQVLDANRKTRSWVYICAKVQEQEAWQEQGIRTRRWFSPRAAEQQLRQHKAEQAELLSQFLET